MKAIQTILLLIFFGLASCNAQTKNTPDKIVGGPCEGCEAIYEYGDKKLVSIDTLAEYKNN